MQQRVSLITLGVRELARARRFYEQGLGWQPSGFSSDEIAFYQVGGMVLSLYPEAALAEETDLPAPSGGRPEGPRFALAHNVPNTELVDALLGEAVRAGGRIVQEGQERFWGGYSGYFADPDGHLWEVAWNPHFGLESDGTIKLEK